MSMQGELFSSSNKSIFFVILDSGVFSWSVLDNEVQCTLLNAYLE